MNIDTTDELNPDNSSRLDEFKKLVIARLYIKQLLFEIGTLQSEVDELNHLTKEERLARNSKLEKLFIENMELKRLNYKLNKDNKELVMYKMLYKGQSNRSKVV